MPVKSNFMFTTDLGYEQEAVRVLLVKKKPEVKNLMRVYLYSIYYAKFSSSASIVRNGCGGFKYTMKLHMVYLT
jgi:hypothetical protein